MCRGDDVGGARGPGTRAQLGVERLLSKNSRIYEQFYLKSASGVGSSIVDWGATVLGLT